MHRDPNAAVSSTVQRDSSREPESGDNPRLSAKRRSRRRREKSDDEFAEVIVSLVRSLGGRCEQADPDTAKLFVLVQDELDAQLARAVAGWRASGATDTQIGAELGVTKQAVAKRWPRRDKRRTR